MNYVGRFFSSVKTIYSEINPATLTGAIDVVVVKQHDGSFVCSPFHVRFGKLGVLRSREKVVDIQINGEPVDLYMKLGENGEAFFVEELQEEEDMVPEYLATSPIPSVSNLFEEGMKQLHSKQSRHARSETESSRDSETSDQRMSARNMRSESQKDVSIDMHQVEEKLADIKLDMKGKSKDKKLTKTKNTLKSLQQDVEACSSQDEESTSKGDPTSRTGSTSHLADVSMETETKGSNSRSRIRAKRKRRKSGKGNKGERLPPQNVSVRRVVSSVSESSTSSSQYSDEEMEGIFPIDDVEDDVENQAEVDEDGVQRLRPVCFPGTEEVTQEEWSGMADKPTQRAFHIFSDGDYTPLVSPDSTRPSTPKSDTEAEHQRQANLRKAAKAAGAEKIEWNWGELPERRVSHPAISIHVSSEDSSKQPNDLKRGADSQGSMGESSTSPGKSEAKSSIWSKLWSGKNQSAKEGGMYLQDLASEEVDPEVYALYFPDSGTQVPPNRIRAIQEVKDEDKSSDLGNSLPQSPNTVITPVVSDSESHHSMTESHHSTAESHQSMSESHQIMVESQQSMEESVDNLRGMQLSLCGGLKEDEDTIPMEHFEKHLISYDDFCKDPSILTNPKLVLRINNKFFNWQMAGPVIIAQLAFQKPLPDEVASSLIKDHMPKGKRSLTSWFWGSSNKPTTPKKELNSTNTSEYPNNPEDEERLRADSMESVPNSGDELEMSLSDKSLRSRISGTERYRKSIRLSSEKLAKLNLQPGPNEIRYSVTTRYQGTTVCESTIYLWHYSNKVIISDIDGTITRSDVFGQILPVLGKDWTHIGVAQLFSSIKDNGYNFLYLSSRAIGQARQTKGYLNSVLQDKASLPDGPLLLNPSSLFQAFHSEVIIRKPEEFKIKCLKDIESLFPRSAMPFYSGFGNRINDTWAYRSVGIPVSRIFTINTQGKVTHEMTKTFQSSYLKLKDLVDHVFPPLHRRTSMAFEAPSEFSAFTFWRNPLPNLPPDDDLLKTS